MQLQTTAGLDTSMPMILGESNIFLVLLMLLVKTMGPLGGAQEKGFN